ncbi:MAG: hypothetical protein RLZZ50_23, partial [Verrucomicrobiota bacterium]
YGIEPGEVDLPLLPLFALFAPALGMTVVVPEIDPSRPAQADPAKLVQAILQEGVTTSFGSPTLWGNLSWHCHKHGVTLPGLRRVLCAGAPVPPWLWDASRRFMPNGRMHSPYGATEALPVSSIAAEEILEVTVRRTLAGAGACVGRVLPENEVRIIAPAEGAIADFSETVSLPVGEIGEIIVRGPTVTLDYDGLPEATAGAKIPDAATGATWHRMGDLGYLDEEGRLWFCGRKVEAVRTERGPLYPAQVEPIFETHAEVRRCALVAFNVGGRVRPAIVVEPMRPEQAESDDCRRLARELRELATRHAVTSAIKVFFFKARLPVDVRHNAKIHRLALTRWVNEEGAVGFESDPKR